MKFTTDSTAIRDEHGRQRIFRGLNICFKKPYSNEKIDRFLTGYLNVLNNSGSNIVRLGITWEMLEPKQGQKNDGLVKILHNFVKSCEENGIYVMLDMHQDLFSRKFCGDGMPSWVIDKRILPKRYMAIWAEGYFYLDCVQRAFNDFWRNKNGVLEKFTDIWKWYRSQFDDCENILGNDFLNEPYITDNGREVFCKIADGIAKENYGVNLNCSKYFEKNIDRAGFIALATRLAKTVLQNGGPKKLLKSADNYEQFSRVISGLEKYTEGFNREYYQPFIDNLDEAVTRDEFTFFEHNYYSNLGIPFEIKAKKNYVYSPHAYDIFVDSALYNDYSSNNRIAFITDKIRENQLKMNVPVMFGEWGAGASGTKWIDHVEFVMDIMEKYQWSNIYWGYQWFNPTFTSRINRPYPVAICGDIIEYKTDSKAREFTLTFVQKEGFDNIENEIYIPKKGIYRFKAKPGKYTVNLKY